MSASFSLRCGAEKSICRTIQRDIARVIRCFYGLLNAFLRDLLDYVYSVLQGLIRFRVSSSEFGKMPFMSGGETAFR